MGGGMDMPATMSAGERRDLLKFENSLAQERDEQARTWQLESERMREAQDKEVRKQTDLAERQRINELEDMEQAAAGAVDPAVDAAQKDVDRQVSSMWGNLSTGTSPEDNRPV